MYNHIKVELQGVQQELQSSLAISTTPLIAGTVEPGYEPTQLHQIVNKVESHLQRVREEIAQAIQALTQVQGVLVEQRNAAE
jgi:hypothetical protein